MRVRILLTTITALLLVGIAFLVLVFLAPAFVLDVPPRLYACAIPSLQAEIPAKVVEDYQYPIEPTDACPITPAHELAMEREYGIIEMLWMDGRSSSDPSLRQSDLLYILARAIDGRSLRVSGARVVEYHDAKPDFLAKYSSRIAFDGQPQTFEIEVLGENEGLIERILFRYVRQRCTCHAGTI